MLQAVLRADQKAPCVAKAWKSGPTIALGVTATTIAIATADMIRFQKSPIVYSFKLVILIPTF
jgi:hypothetical protein